MAKNDTIYLCLVAAFDNEGLEHISSESDRIVWGDMPQEVVVALGNSVTDCLAASGIDVPELAGAFDSLRAGNQVTSVGDLVATIAQL
jgi:hypothetical protein